MIPTRDCERVVFLGPATKLPAYDPNDRQEILIDKKKFSGVRQAADGGNWGYGIQVQNASKVRA